jgi:restriction endonuclease
MGAFWSSRVRIVTSLSELVGYKSGLALTREEIATHLPQLGEFVTGPDDQAIRVRSEEYEQLVRWLLYKVGRIPTPHLISPTITLYHKYKKEAKKHALQSKVATLFVEEYRKAIEKAQSGGHTAVDLVPFVMEAGKQFGPKGFKMAMELVDLMIVYQEQRPYGSYRQVEWKDVAALADLFESENLETYYGQFFDQRFIDYLARNFESIDRINWRKFEGLTAEFFVRAGFDLGLGPGRNDGSIDVRVWPKKGKAGGLPPAMLVQCKREQRKIEKVVVKAL